MKCILGPKKQARLSQLIGRQVLIAFVRGGWPHEAVEVWFPGEATGHMYDRNTGEPMPERVRGVA